MTPLFHPQLVNDPFGDPGLYVDFMFEKRALLFDLGDLGALSSRKLLKVSHAFVSHAHIDHFSGFDRLLRLILGRGRDLHLFGPAAFIDRVRHKLGAYTWNLVAGFADDLVIHATEVHAHDRGVIAAFRLKDGFREGSAAGIGLVDGVVLDEEGFRVRAAVLDHGIPCLGFALEEKRHVNVWKSALDREVLRAGPWLRELRRAVLRDDADETPIRVWWREAGRVVERVVPLGELKARILRIVPGQRFAYVVDAAFHAANAKTITALAAGADTLFIEAAFLEEDAAVAAGKRHLTAHQAGTIARLAGVERLVPFHFSPRYADRGDLLIAEAMAAFAPPPGTGRPT